MTIKHIALAAALMLVASPSHAVDPIILGAGSVACGAWLRAEKGTDSESIEFYASGVGFMSGLMTAFNDDLPVRGAVSSTRNGRQFYDVTEGIDLTDVLAQLKNYCAKNPITNIHDATIEVLGELVRKRGTKIPPR